MKFKAEHRLRQPRGQHAVGCTWLEYAYPAESSSPRRIPCVSFYPATAGGDGVAAHHDRYVHPDVLEGAEGIVCNSVRDATLLDGRHPLLVFSHGYGMYCEANAVQCEELASRGYIILSVGHPGEGSYEWPDGHTTGIDEAVVKAFSSGRDEEEMEEFVRYVAWLRESGPAASDEVHRQRFAEALGSRTSPIRKNAVWVKDSLVALEGILAEESPFASHIDRERIGAFGMSFGGATAFALTLASPLVRVAADLDGGYMSPRWEEPLAVPILALQSDRYGMHLEFPFRNAKGDAYLVTIENSGHMDFSDFAEIVDEPRPVINEEHQVEVMGTVDGDRMEEILNGLLVGFFGKYLNGQSAPLLDGKDLPSGVLLRRKRADAAKEVRREGDDHVV